MTRSEQTHIKKHDVKRDDVERHDIQKHDVERRDVERHLHLDCQSGVAGDMLLSALIDLGAPQKPILDALAEIGLPRPAFQTERVRRRGIAALHLSVPEAEGPSARAVHHEEICERLEKSRLEERVKSTGLKVLDRLAEAEAAVHGIPKSKVHYHELGGNDTLVDVVGVVKALDLLGAPTLTSSPITVGFGEIKTDHGIMPVPAFATMELLKGIPISSGTEPMEMTTPTGAALVSTLVRAFGPAPAMVVEAVGHGAGTRNLESRANLLRAVLGRPRLAVDEALDRMGSFQGKADTEAEEDPNLVIEIRTNLDDATGELAAHAVARLMEAGALDAWIQPIVMKKGRPAFLLTALARNQDRRIVIATMISETPTMGVRWSAACRLTLDRRTVEVSTRYGKVEMMVGKDGSGNVRAAPEYESCLAAARAANVPLHEVMTQATRAFVPEDPDP